MNLIHPSNRVRFVDSDGRLTADAVRMLTALFVRAGGYTAPSNSELLIDLPDDAGIEELKDDLYRFKDAIQTVPAQEQARLADDLSPPTGSGIASIPDESIVYQLLASLNSLRLEVDALKQGLLA